ncbi:MAG: radical SAM protein [Candidatus Omnitrophota bacterium]
MIKKAYIDGNGCPMSKAENKLLESFFRKNGFRMVAACKNADLAVYNSCACCKSHEDTAISQISKIQKRLPKSSKLIVCGCLPRINKARLEKKFQGAAFGPQLSMFNKLVPHTRPIEKIIPEFAKDDYHMVRIADGCLGKCSFCAVKHARGRLKSRDPEDVLREIKFALRAGHKKIDLVASDLGCYGKDINTGILCLLTKILKLRGDFKVKLGPVCPNYLQPILDDFIRVFKNNKFERSLQLDIESGSDRILGLMNRRYNVSCVRQCVKALIEEIPSLKITSNFIVGFPGESKADFDMTMAIVRELSVLPEPFKFSKRPFTKAQHMPGQLSNKEISRRYRQLKKLGERIRFLSSSYFKDHLRPFYNKDS